jgi:hypothetical protein
MSQNHISLLSVKIFRQSIDNYHRIDKVDQPFKNPYPSDALEHLLYRKNWIDTVQWHYEDLIRDPEIEPGEGMKLKRLIDASNQDRTDTVEYIDSYFLNNFKNVAPQKNATVNSESPAWALDRLSIFGVENLSHGGRSKSERGNGVSSREMPGKVASSVGTTRRPQQCY